MSSATVVRRTTLTIPDGEVGADLDGERGFLASERCALGEDARWLACHLPPLAPNGPHRVAIADLTASPASMRIESGVLAEGGALVITSPEGPRLVGGNTIPGDIDAPRPPRAYVVERWLAPVGAPGPLVRLAGIRGMPGWSFESYDLGGATRSTQTRAAPLPGEPIGAAMSPDHATVAVSLRVPRDQPAFELTLLDRATSAIRWRTPLAAQPVGTLRFSVDGAEIAVLARDAARCESCVKILIASARDGRAGRDIPLPPSTIADNATSAGFGRETLWFYSYVPAHATSELAPAGRTPVPVRCAYEAYDLRAPDHPPRVLADAEGDWKHLTTGCQVRALIQLTGGRVAAIQMVSATEVVLVELDRAP